MSNPKSLSEFQKSWDPHLSIDRDRLGLERIAYGPNFREYASIGRRGVTPESLPVEALRLPSGSRGSGFAGPLTPATASAISGVTGDDIIAPPPIEVPLSGPYAISLLELSNINSYTRLRIRGSVTLSSDGGYFTTFSTPFDETVTFGTPGVSSTLNTDPSEGGFYYRITTNFFTPTLFPDDTFVFRFASIRFRTCTVDGDIEPLFLVNASVGGTHAFLEALNLRFFYRSSSDPDFTNDDTPSVSYDLNLSSGTVPVTSNSPIINTKPDGSIETSMTSSLSRSTLLSDPRWAIQDQVGSGPGFESDASIEAVQVDSAEFLP